MSGGASSPSRPPGRCLWGRVGTAGDGTAGDGATGDGEGAASAKLRGARFTGATLVEAILEDVDRRVETWAAVFAGQFPCVGGGALRAR